jgi:hypothetical protein
MRSRVSGSERFDLQTSSSTVSQKPLHCTAIAVSSSSALWSMWPKGATAQCQKAVCTGGVEVHSWMLAPPS